VPNPSPGGGFDAEWGMLRKCRIATLFRDKENPDSSDDQLILDFIIEGRMTTQTCRALVRGERAFRDMIWREKYGQ